MEIVELSSSTDKWSLVVQQVSQHSIAVWAGTLFADLRMPEQALLRLLDDNGVEVASQLIVREQWLRPFRRLSARFYYRHSFSGLTAGKLYRIEFFRLLSGPGYDGRNQWQRLQLASCKTLPAALPAASSGEAFTLSLSSCFYDQRDGGQAALSFCQLYRQADPLAAPDVRLMVGDQVYLDIGMDSLSPLTNEVRQRIADDYARHWQLLGPMLRCGGGWMLPDDHEYWNDYPFYDSPLPTLFMLKLAPIRHAWTQASEDGVHNVQQSEKISMFNIGSDVSVCLADLRSYRSKSLFIDQSGFAQLLDWIRQLRCPGLLVLPQILFDDVNKTERNLLSFPGQYQALVQALAAAPHDMVVLSGDVHFGRISQLQWPTGRRLVEIVASPLSNLSGVNSIAADVAKASPRQFPVLPVPGVPPQQVQYDKAFQVSSLSSKEDEGYLKRRTREHLMTIGLQKDEHGALLLTAQAWRVRERTGQGMPKADFASPFVIRLR